MGREAPHWGGSPYTGQPKRSSRPRGIGQARCRDLPTPRFTLTVLVLSEAVLSLAATASAPNWSRSTWQPGCLQLTHQQAEEFAHHEAVRRRMIPIGGGSFHGADGRKRILLVLFDECHVAVHVQHVSAARNMVIA